MALFLWSSVASAQSAEDISYITEPYYPYNYEENGELKGISVDLLELVWKELGIPPQHITIMPWVRGYKLVQLQPNTMLFSMARTQEREGLFRWVGPIHTVRFVLIGKKARAFKIRSTTDLQGLSIGTLIDDVGDVILDSLSNVRIEPVADISLSLKMLDYDRVDLVAYEEESFSRLAAANGLDPEAYEAVFVLKETGVYYALHSDTPDALVTSLQRAFDKIASNPEHQRILETYLQQQPPGH